MVTPKRKPKRKLKAGNPKMLETLAAAIRTSVPIPTAARLAGITETTYHRWRREGLAGLEAGHNNVKTRFVEVIQNARAHAEASLVKDYRTFAQRDHKATSGMLARVYPERWAEPGKRWSHAQEVRMKEALIAKAEAEADYARARADMVRKAADGPGQMLLMPQDVLDGMPVALRADLMVHLADQGVAMVSHGSLGAGVTPDEAAKFSPSLEIGGTVTPATTEAALTGPGDSDG